MSQETANFMRLARLLVDKGTEALRKEFDAIHPPANLPAVLAASQKSLLRLKFRVINKSQWDLLYPPSGKPPDSKTFDVSLLTVLFRNICGLPSTGWDAMPLDSDRSLQANIIRIKTLRNEVYAHAKATRMDDATFESLLVKICQALLELKILQKDIDDLKTSPLSPEEKNYGEALRNWKLNDEELQEKVEDVRSDVKDMKDDVKEIKKHIVMQQQGDKETSQSSTTLPWQRVEDTNINLSHDKDEDLLQTLAKHDYFEEKISNKVTNNYVEVNFQEKLEDLSTDVKDTKDDVTDIKDDVKDKKDDVTDMKDDVKVSKDDVKDMKDDVEDMKHDVKDMKDDVKDMKDDVKDTKDDVKDMKDRVKDMKDDVKDMKDRVKGTKDDVKDMKDDVKGTKDDVKDMKNDVRDMKDDVKDIKDRVKDIKDDVKDIKQIKKRLGMQQRSQISTTHPLKGVDDTGIEINRYKDEDLLRKLAKHNFAATIKGKMKYFFSGTREWLLQDVEDWFNENEQESKILLVKAGPGFGKSVFAAKICEIFREKGKLAACFFCDFRDANLRDPMTMLQSLASQMCKNVDGFKEKLLDQLKRPHKIHTIKEAFRIYLQNPLDELEVAEPSLVVIDGLDESAANDRSDIVSLISECFSELPDCIKFLITSRPEISIAKLSDIPNINIGNNDRKNDADIEIYLKFCLPKLLEREEDSYSVLFKRLVKMCEGSFLYAYHCQYELGKRDDLANVTSSEIVEFLPKGIGSVYEKYFKRLERELRELQHCRLDVLKFLEILVAAKRSLPLTFVAKALGLAPDCRETRRIINKVNEAISCLLYVADDMVTVFHKTVIDWLLARGYEGHDYVVNISDGNKLLWLVCEQTFEEIKRRPLSEYKRELTPGENYALYFGSRHLHQCNMPDSFSWFVDVVIVCAIMHHIEDCYDTLFDTWDTFLSEIDKLRGGTVQINNKLRARLRWHRVILVEELDLDSETGVPYSYPSELLYLERILARPSNDYFNDEEKTFARSVLSLYVPLFVENDVDVLPLEEWHVETLITAVRLSKDKTTAAVAMEDGTISLVSVPTLFQEWQYDTGYEEILSVTFAPDGSFLLFGKLETVLDIAQKKEVAFFAEYSETFISCVFSPNGLRLITSHGYDPMKVWDVAGQRLISELETGVFVNWCTFDITGLFIVAFDKINYFEFCSNSDYDFRFRDDPVEYHAKDSFSIWNAFTLQRCDERILPEIKKRNTLHSGKCKRCFWPGIAKQPTYRVCRCPEICKLFLCVLPFDHNYQLSTGIYNGVECYFALGDHSFNVVETTHFTTLAAWDCFTFTFGRYEMFIEYAQGIAAIDNDHWLYSDERQLVVLRTPVAIPPVVIVHWSSFSPDSSRLATCSSDGYIKIWNVDKRQVEQRFKVDQGETPFVCWLSKEFLFVFNSIDGMPCLWKFPVWRNSKILFTKGEQHSLTYLRNEFVSASQVVEFSGGLLFLKFGETAPVKVLDVNRDGEPQITTLPVVNILVSPDGVFVLSIGKKTLNIWKRNSTNALQFDFFLSYERVSKPQSYYTRFNTLFRFSNDSKVVVFSESKPFRLSTGDFEPPSVRETVILDLVTRSLKRVLLSDDSSYLNWFCLNKNRVIIATSLHRIHVFDMDSGAQIWSPAGQNFLKRFAEMKLSPDETVLALPKLNGDMKFIRLSIAHNALLEEIKKNAAINWQNEITGTK